MRRPLLALLVIAALAAGCGEDEPTRDTSSPLDAVEVTGDAGEKPTLEFSQPLEVSETTTRTIEEGDGEAITAGSLVSFDFLVVNARDGKELGSSYETEPQSLTFEESLNPGIYDGLDGVPAGSRVLVGIAPDDAPPANPEQGVKETDTVLFYAEIHDVGPGRAEGEAVDPVDGLPTVELGEDGAPTITVPDTEPPAELIVQPLIEGDGAVVEAGQTITVHYTGVIWDTGEVFDSSWERGAPATFEIGTGAVILGWDEGLVDQTVGSQILLVIPPAKGYPEGSSDGSIKATDTIVFVVDILDAR